MALINCPECNREVSDKAKVCPHCGYPIVDDKKVNIVSVNGTEYDISNIKKQYDIISEENKQRLYKRSSWQYRCCLNPELTKKKAPDFGGDKSFFGGDITQEICKTFNWWKKNDKMHLTYKFLVECVNHNFTYFEFNTADYPIPKQPTPQPVTSQNVVRCPRCGSTSVTTEEKGYGLFGWIGASQKKNLCQKCGHKWWPGR